MDQSQVTRTTRNVAARKRQVSQPDIFDEEFDDIWPTQHASSVRRYHSDTHMERGRVPSDAYAPGYGERQPGTVHMVGKHAVPPRRSLSRPSLSAAGRRTDMRTEDDIVLPHHVPHVKIEEHPQIHWLVYAGAAILVMVLGWTLLTAVIHWWQITMDDLHYGRPRTYQTDVVVGHNDSSIHPSHFIALNLNRHVEVIEFPGGDATKAKVYVGPVLVGPDQDLTPVTLTFKDVNHDGKLDMIVNVQSSHILFINDQGQFRPLRPDEGGL